MNFVLDANIPISAVELFEEYGVVYHVRQEGLSKAPDDEIVEYAQKQEAIIVTRDLEFSNPNVYSPDSYLGLIVLRVPNYFIADDINDVFKKFLEDIEVENLENGVYVVQPGSFRVKRL